MKTENHGIVRKTCCFVAYVSEPLLTVPVLIVVWYMQPESPILVYSMLVCWLRQVGGVHGPAQAYDMLKVVKKVYLAAFGICYRRRYGSMNVHVLVYVATSLAEEGICPAYVAFIC